MNSTAVRATGWMIAQAKGQPLERIFSIINEHTRESVESPVAKILQEGKIIGLAITRCWFDEMARKTRLLTAVRPYATETVKLQGSFWS